MDKNDEKVDLENFAQNDYFDLLENVNKIKGEIVLQLMSSANYDPFIKDDLPNILNKYIEQTEQLIWRYNKINNLLKSISLVLIEKSISELHEMLLKTTIPAIKEQCAISIGIYQSHRTTIISYQNQRENLKQKLDTTIMSLLKIKFDLLKMEGLSSAELLNELYQNFEKRSIELSDYLSSLKI